MQKKRYNKVKSMQSKALRVMLMVFCCALVISAGAVLASAQTIPLPEPPELSGVTAYCFYNLSSDMQIASQEDSLELDLSCTASAKIMTGLLCCERLGGRIDEYIQITSDMLMGVSGQVYGFKAGESVKIYDLLYAAICGSYNDAAYILACVIGGSSSEFVTLMNKRAHELGATKTNYTNPIGYPSSTSMVTTAANTAKIAAAAYKNPLYMEICSTYRYTMSDSDIKITNKNSLLDKNSAYFNKKCMGMNVGSNGDKNGWSLVCAASDGTQEYICVILGANDGTSAYTSANKLIKWAYDEYKTHTVYKKGEEIGLIDIGLTGMASSKASYVTATDLNIYIQKEVAYTEGALTVKKELILDEINAPVSAGSVVGQLKVYYNGHCVGKCDLVLSESYEPNGILLAINNVSEYLHSRAFIIGIIAAAILIPSSVIYVKLKNTRRRYKK